LTYSVYKKDDFFDLAKVKYLCSELNMKTMSLEKIAIDACIHNAQKDRVLITRNGKPVALVIGVEGMDREQLELGCSNKFWSLIMERRSQKIISRNEVEKRTKSGRRL
jgi:PHD/YefM family antitoxin component YafN of YafNO toxin-antitoxin module